ncbi:OLC1v1028196C1 [Oldenlandia corymbosa var. corymbosa]|uniref:OLC1v1028196C1 n=1 Tax=Oldenlandia corymbosa var. corymbosa TaxID=529605 RepID=A0AAV1CB55_OLDCO|nr:OLC1v1028196C1 [Oldenlandia corymbosa var. corymbosa]
MDALNPLKYQSQPLIKRLLPWLLSALLPIALMILYFYPFQLLLSPSNLLLEKSNTIITDSKLASSSVSPVLHKERVVSKDEKEITCDYSDGIWIHDSRGPLYNGTTCNTIKDGQNCMRHGRPDMDYMYWRWKPNVCTLPRFDPEKFLHLLRNKSLAFVGDSVARNQLESLICMMATVSSPNLLHTNGEDNKFRKWHFPSHNVTVAIFWSPFLVRGIEKTDESDVKRNFNRLYLDSVDEKWAGEVSNLDMIVLSMGHWFLLRAVYHYGDTVLGCHFCTGQNYSEIGFYDVYGKAYKTALNAIIDRKGSIGDAIDVFVTTFTPSHFEGEWDKFGACSKTQPEEPTQKKLVGMDAEMRNAGIREIEAAKMKAKEFGKKVRFQAVDVSWLSLLRPDGHPGPYSNPFPFANGITDRVQNDCVHWCLPGPIDTWNEILLEFMNKWEGRPITYFISSALSIPKLLSPEMAMASPAYLTSYFRIGSQSHFPRNFYCISCFKNHQNPIFAPKDAHPFLLLPKQSTSNLVLPLSTSPSSSSSSSSSPSDSSPIPTIRNPLPTGRFLTNDELAKLEFLENYCYFQELKSGYLYMRVMEQEELDLTAGLLAESFADSMFLPKGYVKLLEYLVKQYLIERRALMPHTATLLGFYKEDEDEDFQVAGTVEVSFNKMGANASPPSPTPPKNSPYICNMTVKESLRRRGIGWHLLKASEELIAQMSSSRDVFLHCRMIDEAPFNMYTRAGYTIVKTDSILTLLTLQRRKHLMYKQIPVSVSPSEMDMYSQEPSATNGDL